MPSPCPSPEAIVAAFAPLARLLHGPTADVEWDFITDTLMLVYPGANHKRRLADHAELQDNLWHVALNRLTPPIPSRIKAEAGL